LIIFPNNVENVLGLDIKFIPTPNNEIDSKESIIKDYNDYIRKMKISYIFKDQTENKYLTGFYHITYWNSPNQMLNAEFLQNCEIMYNEFKNMLVNSKTNSIQKTFLMING
jgi:hypothetical protein